MIQAINMDFKVLGIISICVDSWI